MKTVLRLMSLSLSASLLAACGSVAEVSEGATLDLNAKSSRLRPSSAAADALAEGTKIFRREDDMRIELQSGYVNLLPLELVRDCGLTARLRWPSLIGSAHAHAGEGHGGATGAGVMNMVEPDGTEYALGALPAAPGSYCGVRVTLAPLTASTAKHGGDVAPVMGSAFTAHACYYPDSRGVPEPAAAGISHSCIAVVIASAPSERLVRFAQPVLVSEMGGAVMLKLDYDTWFDGLDMSLLASDAAEQQKLLENVMESVSVE